MSSVESLYDQLLERMREEQDKYREWLKGQPSEEVLNHAFEYTAREDILVAMETLMENLELDTQHYEVLLESPTPLADLYKDYQETGTTQMEVIWNCLEDRAEDLLKEKETQECMVVVVEPGKPAYQKQITMSLETLQKEVGGYIEAIHPFEDQVCLVANEEGKLNGSVLNRALRAEPETMDMSYKEMCEIFRSAEKRGSHALGYIVFSQDSYDKAYPEEARTYVVSSDNKAFQETMGGYSIYGSSLDGKEHGVRLERYMADEYGGANGWKIERCYMKEQSREIVDIVAGTFLIVGVGEESFKGLSPEQASKYLEEFKTPESFIDLRGKVLVAPMTVYSKSAQYAREHSEMDVYRVSMQANRACKEDIERAIGEHYNANKLDSRSAVKEVLERFGAERTSYVLACTIQDKMWDGRISEKNKAWADAFLIDKDSEAREVLHVTSHSGLVDLFVTRLRQTLEQDLVGRITFTYGGPMEFTDSESYLQAIRAELPYMATTGFRCETLTSNPEIRKAVDDIICDFCGEVNPRQIDDYQIRQDRNGEDKMNNREVR